MTANQIDIYLEFGKKRSFAGAIGWPGWCRSGRDEEAALQARFDYGPRYALVLRSARLVAAVAELGSLERLGWGEGVVRPKCWIMGSA
jgi:hypothetical protein